jgi:hypothetical protein
MTSQHQIGRSEGVPVVYIETGKAATEPTRVMQIVGISTSKG